MGARAPEGTRLTPRSVRLESARGLWAIDQVEMGTPAPARLDVRTLEPARAEHVGGRDLTWVLSHEDGRYHTAFPGDTVAVEFQAPPLPEAGGARSVLVRSRGFYHLFTDQAGPVRGDLADRILDEPLFGNRYILERWLEGS